MKSRHKHSERKSFFYFSNDSWLSRAVAFPFIDPGREGLMSMVYNLTAQTEFATTHFYYHT